MGTAHALPTPRACVAEVMLVSSQNLARLIGTHIMADDHIRKCAVG